MAQRNPPWTKDEVILALDLYTHLKPASVSVNHPEIVALSNLLNQLPIHPPHVQDENFRNPNGVHMKMFNLQWLDPAIPGGLNAGSKVDIEVWNEFANDYGRLHSVATAIRGGVGASNKAEIAEPVDEEEEAAPEGKILLRMHKIRERNSALVRKKKDTAMQKYGYLACEVCNFVFSKLYGAIGDGFIECHHTIPLSQLQPGQTTKLADLALVCANCHRMLHRGGEVMTIANLRAVIQPES